MTSLLFLGNETSNITIPYDPAMNINELVDFTIEWFQYQTDTNNFPRIFQRGSYPSATIGVSIELDDFYLWLSGQAFSIASLTDYKNKWVHFAISRNGATIRVFLDGVEIGSVIDAEYALSSTNNLVIGNESEPSDDAAYGGYIYGFQWTIGEGKYAANFTVPTTLTLTPNTILLLTGNETRGTLAGTVVRNNVSTINDVPPAFRIQSPDYQMIPYIQSQRRPVLSNNLIFYKPKSLAPCGVGSSVNSRVKSRKT